MDLLSNYDIEIKADTGSVTVGQLYTAEDLRTGRSVAIRFLPRSAALSRQVVETHARFPHRALPMIYDFGETEDGTPYVVMQDLRGFMPASELNSAIPVEQAIDVAVELAGLFSASAQEHLLHGNINPSNILLGPSGQVKVMDFGIVESVPREIGFGFNELTAPPSPYIAPELLALETRDQRSEIFSFGATLYTLLTGRPPAIVGSICEKDRGFITKTSQQDPRERALCEIIAKCLRSDPSERYQSFDEIVHQFRSISGPPLPQAPSALAATAATSIAYSLRPEILSTEGLQSLFTDKRKAFAFAAFLVSSLITVIGLVSYSGTRIGFAMAFGGALLAYESVLLFSALIKDR